MTGPVSNDNGDVEEFIEQVDEVHRLIEGLKAGTISPDYIDRKQEIKQQKALIAKGNVQRPAGRAPTSDSAHEAPGPSEAPGTDVNPQQNDEEVERRERAMAKVQELIANRERKLRARARYEEYVKEEQRTQYGTDYTKWDIWCPEDEEDEMINSIGPNTPQFRAMEKDIDERHRQMVERRQLAERSRVAGNAAYAAKQYSEAVRCYQQGLDAERSNMALHANAAQAALKMSCFVQAIEHCDKVLHIAEFFHSNPSHPLCVKARQRRAEAYRALQQHGRCVADLEAAAALAPGDAEIAKQLARARQDEAEHRKQRAIAKAVSKAAAGSLVGSGDVATDALAVVSTAEGGSGKVGEGAAGGPEAPGAGVKLDLEKLWRVERLVAVLGEAGALAAGTAEESGSAAGDCSGADSRQACKGEEAGAASQGHAARGPSLPARLKGKAAPAEPPNGAAAPQTSGAAPPAQTDADPVIEACKELRQLLVADDTACVYFRECGGLRHLADKINQRASAMPLAPLLLLLNEACMNDGNLQQLPALKGLLPACVGALGAGGAAGAAAARGADAEAAAAAAVLLCTAVTREEVRKAVSKLLGTGAAMQRLLALLAGAAPTVQGVALALLGNCMVDKQPRAAMAAAWGTATKQQGGSSSSAAAPAASPAASPAAACFRALVASPNLILREKAVTLLGNMANDAGLRAAIATDRELGGQLLGAATEEHGSDAGAQGLGKQQQEQRRKDLDQLRLAAITALYNLAIDEAGQQLVAADPERLGRLYALLWQLTGIAGRTEGNAAAAADVQGGGVLAARLAGLLARVAKAPAGGDTLLKQGVVGGMVRMAARATDHLAAAGATRASGSAGRDADLALLDAAVRTLTLLTGRDDPAAGADPSDTPAAQLLAAGGVAVLLRALGAVGPASPPAAGSTAAATAPNEAVLANAALCLAGVARRTEHLAALRAADAVPPLLKVAYDGRGSAASRNAAIALARCAHDPDMLTKLRELHGIEIIYQYVKP